MIMSQNENKKSRKGKWNYELGESKGNKGITSPTELSLLHCVNSQISENLSTIVLCRPHPQPPFSLLAFSETLREFDVFTEAVFGGTKSML